MATISRGSKASGGTTFLDGTTAYGSEVETDVNTVYTNWNNTDAGTTKWTVVSALNASSTVVIADNSSGTNSVAEFRVNGTAKVTVDSVGNLKTVWMSNYRRPILQYSSATVVNIETGLTGTSGQAIIQFSDGTFRTDSTSSRINLTISQNAVLSGTAQSGLRTGSATASTWYAVYAVKVTDSSTNFVTVADTVIPTQANYATLNTNFGTNGWAYLGMIRYGDNAGATTVILDFIQTGNYTVFKNVMTGNAGENTRGTKLATTDGATSLSYTYSAGTGAANIPSHLTQVIYGCVIGTNPAASSVSNQAGTLLWQRFNIATRFFHFTPVCPASEGYQTACTNSQGQDIVLAGFVDGALGVGSNPLL